jgi:hypothetical protein
MRHRDTDQPAQRRLQQVAARQERPVGDVRRIFMSETRANAQSSHPHRRRTAAGTVLTAILAAGVLGACSSTPGPAGGTTTPPESSGGTGSNGNWYTGGYRYEAGGALPEPATQAEAYRLPPVQDADLVHIARAFGIKGSERDQGAQKSISDGVRRVSAAGSAWAVSRIGAAGREQPATTGCVPSTATSRGGCAVNPSPASDAAPTPTGSPTPEERRARALLAKAGLDLREATAETGRQGGQWAVRLSPKVAGLPVVGGDSVVSGRGASSDTVEGHGFLTMAAKTGTRPLIGVQAGLKRLNDGLFIGASPITGTVTPGAGSGKVLTVSSAELVLGLEQPDVALLVPAYRFTLQDGSTRTTAAVQGK